MGTYHTFFVAADAALTRLFPGWEPAKAQKVERQRVNPFTREAMIVSEWEPVEPPRTLGKPSLYDDAWGRPVPPIVPAADAYMAQLEEAGAPGLRALPHFRAKNFEPFVMSEALVEALVGPNVPAPPARIGPMDDDDVPFVWALPDAACRRLAEIDDSELDAIMGAVLEADATGVELGNDSKTRSFFVEHGLRPLKTLAIEAIRTDARVCHYFALHY